MFEVIPNWHPVFVKFGFALSVTGALAGILLCMGIRSLREPLSHFTQIALAIGAVTLSFAVVSGFWAFATLGVEDVVARAAMVTHRNWAFVAAIVAIVVSAATLAAPKLLDTRGWSGAFLLMAALLVFAASRGAEVVYRHGVGVLQP